MRFRGELLNYNLETLNRPNSLTAWFFPPSQRGLRGELLSVAFVYIRLRLFQTGIVQAKCSSVTEMKCGVLLVTVFSGKYRRPLHTQLRPNDSYSEHRPQEQRSVLRRDLHMANRREGKGHP